MTINSTGPISLGGTAVGQSIEIELSGNGSSPISLNDTNVRTLLGIPNGQISLSNAYGKSAVITPGPLSIVAGTIYGYTGYKSNIYPSPFGSISPNPLFNGNTVTLLEKEIMSGILFLCLTGEHTALEYKTAILSIPLIGVSLSLGTPDYIYPSPTETYWGWNSSAYFVGGTTYPFSIG